MTDAQQKKAAKEFAARWKDKGYEKGESQKFWIDLLVNVYGVTDIAGFISFEDKVKLDNTSFIDGYIPSTHVMIEQKSLGKNLRKAIKQSDGSMLSPFQQAKRYSAELPYDDRPRWIITCNFGEFLIYDMNKPNSEPEQVFLKDLPKEYYRLQFLVDTGKIIEKLYKALREQYQNPDSPESLKSLNMLCVRLVFCFYADKSGIFKHNQFKHYLQEVPVNKWNRELKDLFRIFDTHKDYRDKYEDDLNAFPYVNGGLFADENIEIPRFTQEIIDIILKDACAFDWQNISPTIFGAIFESTLNPETRRSGGMHYTSVENIHKVINPLFLDDLRKEFEEIKAVKRQKDGITRKQMLDDFQKKLSSLTFLDPACGSGNFLTETYLSLRRLENEVIRQQIFTEGDNEGQTMLADGGIFNPIKVSIGQFYGIEINDFAVSVAKTALWIAENQMLQETEQLMQVTFDFLPLKSYANIVEGNALRIDWESVVPKTKLSYIMGNPPFVGNARLSEAQKADRDYVFSEKGGELDYVSCWYKKAADFIGTLPIKCAFVSTNSICQGQQVYPLWKNLFDSGIKINFAHRTFQWDSEANEIAHVYCIIVGFSRTKANLCVLFDNGTILKSDNINAYLLSAPNVFIEKRKTPLSHVPIVIKGFQPTDHGYLILSNKEKEALLKKEPDAKPWIRQFITAKEYIHGEKRWCLWLVDISPKDLNHLKEIKKRVAACQEWRSSQTKSGDAYKLRNMPTLMRPNSKYKDGSYIVLPLHTGEKRKYIPLGFSNDGSIPGNSVSIVPDATLFHFGILTSNVHMAWMRTVCGRLEMRYRYASDIVYNTFPWCIPTPEQKAKIEKTAQTILDARAKYPDCSLADLYDELTMPLELRKAHQMNDVAVMQAYGFDYKTMTESECVAELMKMYQKLTENN